MTTATEAHSLIANALTRLGLQPPGEPTDSLSITLKDGTVLWLDVTNGGDRVCLWNEFMQWPAPEHEAGLFEALMRIHAFGTATGGAAFSANREAGSIVVFKSLATSRLDAGALADELESLVELITRLREGVQQGVLQQPSAGAVPVPASFA